MKRLKPIVRGVEAEEVDKTPLEEYWLRNISACTVVRWDLFEEALCRDFCVSINTSIGRVRKINWDYLLKKLLKHIASKNNEIDLWPGHPGLASTPFPGSVVSLSSFQVCITSGKIKKILSKSIRSDTFYLGEKYKNSTYVFACGSRYTGNWKNFKRDGLAKMEVKEGFEYNGYFFKGLRHGYGLCKGMGCEFKGYWEEDLFDGPGEMGYSDLSAINGVWKKGNIVSGRLKFSGGEYTGYFNSLYFEGTGILTAKNGDVKKGTWNHSKLNGDCEILMKNGSVYRGSFEEDLLEGNGFIEAPLFIYKGSVKSSLPEGSGLMIYKTLNAEYEGEFIQGVINRKGIYKIDNQMLKGEFIHGKLIGKGEKLIGTSSRYVGEFTDSLMHGKGVLRFNSEKFKGIYNGDFRLNKLHGQGKMKIDNFE